MTPCQPGCPKIVHNLFLGKKLAKCPASVPAQSQAKHAPEITHTPENAFWKLKQSTNALMGMDMLG